MKRITLIGGNGFIGSHLATQLAARGDLVTVPTRHRDAGLARSNPSRQIQVVEADVHDPAQLAELVASHDVVINLVGILNGSEAEFEHAHVTLTEKIVGACEASGVKRYLHMSALGADVNGPSRYQRSKGRAENVVRRSRLAATIYRPSVVFGQGDSFLTLFARITRLAPLLPLGAAAAQFQPIWVEDVVRAFVAGIDRPELAGMTLNLVGPGMYTLAEIVRYTGSLNGRTTHVLPLPAWAASAQAAMMMLLPDPPLTQDNLDSMKTPNIDPAGFPSILGWHPAAMEDIAPTYLGKNAKAGDGRRAA
ncbi:complex I NDUFA9 subunit family protein [Andreprevotia chitinilytica]|uniref:complex I NDUFA9 subunit family protein n=1 Tax=Andreprevotia chitinilytica TaxID=396808 RepID=UPI00055148D0|nr:complex I NDUFA9 subunit family protein [Andreprevotia chitinilytica]